MKVSIYLIANVEDVTGGWKISTPLANVDLRHLGKVAKLVPLMWFNVRALPLSRGDLTGKKKMQPASAGSEIWGPVTCHVFLKRCMYIYIYRDFIDLILLCGRSGSQMSLLSQQYLKTCAACLNQTKLYDPLQIRLVGGNPTHPRHAKYLSLESCVYLSRKQRYHASNSHMIPRIALYGVPT